MSRPIAETSAVPRLYCWKMNPNRSLRNNVGEFSSRFEIDDKENQSTDTIGPVPDANQDGHQGDDHPDKPVAKFAERYPADAAGDDERGDVADNTEDDAT